MSRRPSYRSECANPHCKRTRKEGQLACLECWRALPVKLQRGIVKAWRENDRETHSALVIEARVEWAKALPA